MKVQPIHRLKDVRAIKKLIADSPRDAAIFTIGINTNLRASDFLGLTIGRVRGVKPGHKIEIIEKKTGKRRRITLNNEVAAAIQRLLLELGDRYKDDVSLFQVSLAKSPSAVKMT
jgi:integrase